jgi:hypothetical protein
MNPLRQATATVLALWLGVLACVLGCSQSVLTSTPSRNQISAPQTSVNDRGDGKLADAGPCCHHHGRTSDKNQGRQTISCCPLDATLTQKQDQGSFKSGHSFLAVLILFVFNPSLRLSPASEKSAPVVTHAGRDILLQAHVLRI